MKVSRTVATSHFTALRHRTSCHPFGIRAVPSASFSPSRADKFMLNELVGIKGGGGGVWGGGRLSSTLKITARKELHLTESEMGILAKVDPVEAAVLTSPLGSRK